jgi:copper(I)-binding protein
MRLPWPAVLGGTLVVALGAAGLIRAAVPQSAAASPDAPSAAGPIVVTGAYVRAPVPPTQIAAAYFTVYNTTGTADRLESVETGAGATAELHTVQPDGSMDAAANGVVIPAHGTLVMTTGKAHVMIEQLFGKLTAGQSVNIELDFQRAGSINVVAPVIAVGAPAPGGSSAPSAPSTHSGAHS